jgi:ribosomal protein S18 acetylase RimI-like enzyme
MTCHDWRDAPADEIASLFAAERRRWLDRLHWDTADSWSIVETGRTAGHVPGWILRDEDGKTLGWTYYLLHDGSLQIGGLSASRPALARRLLDAVLTSPEAALARSLSCWLLPECAGTASAFERQRFRMGETIYLERALAGDAIAAGSAPIRARPWRESDLASVVRLLRDAYRGVPGAACFAPDDLPQQWAQYTGQLLRTPACGRFDPSLSFVVTSTAEADLRAAVLVSRISAATAHVMQIAVGPDCRRQGVGEALLQRVASTAAAAGCTTLTLMVDAANAPARTLYNTRGFREVARFLYGSRAARTRVAA